MAKKQIDPGLDQVKEMLDVAILQPTATAAEVERVAQVVRDELYGFLCVNACHVRRAAQCLVGAKGKVIACVAFPFGATATETKVFETQRALADGAEEIDMVMNLGAFLGGEKKRAMEDIREVVAAADGKVVKVIIETAYLSTDQKVDAAKIVQEAGAAFVKTCTGFSADAVALYEDVRLLRQTVGPKMGVKASGRIRNYLRFISMVEAGANRIGLGWQQAQEIVKGWHEAHG